MLAEYKSKTWTFAIAGIVLQIAGSIISKIPLIGWLVGIPVGALGTLLFIMGCCFYAKAKGYSWLFGLLGLLSFVGLIILYFLPDLHDKR